MQVQEAELQIENFQVSAVNVRVHSTPSDLNRFEMRFQNLVSASQNAQN